MDINYQNLKEEVKKINQRIKEYLWKKSNRNETSNFKFTNSRC